LFSLCVKGLVGVELVASFQAFTLDIERCLNGYLLVMVLEIYPVVRLIFDVREYS